MWCLSLRELCKLKEADQRLLVPLSKSRTYSAVVLVPSTPVKWLISYICYYPISSVWLRQTPSTAVQTPHSHACLRADKNVSKQTQRGREAERQRGRERQTFFKATYGAISVDTQTTSWLFKSSCRWAEQRWCYLRFCSVCKIHFNYLIWKPREH